MPHVEIKYSKDLDINSNEMFDVVEDIINDHDSSAGECKSRGYPTAEYKYSHIFINISLLTKAHRDQEFTNQLSAAIETAIKGRLTQSCYFSLKIDYSLNNYVTNVHLVDGDELA